MSDIPGKIALLTLSIFLILFCVFAVLNYNCHVHSDPGTYLDFASSLAQGSMHLDNPPEAIFQTYFSPDEFHLGMSTHILKDKKVLSPVSIGYPLFLSSFIRFGGKYAPFLANTFVFVAFFVVLYQFSRLLFHERDRSNLIALLTVFLYFLINKTQIIYLLRCYRDPLSYTLMIGGFCFYLKYLRKQERTVYLFPAFLLIGLSCVVRETSVLCLLPMGLLYLATILSRRKFVLIKPAASFLLFFSIGISPLIIQNWVNNGNPLYPTQMLWGDIRQQELQKDDESPLEKSYAVPGMSFQHFPITSKRIILRLHDKYPIWAGILLILGFIFGRKSQGIWYLLLPFILLYFVFYGCYISSPWRYIFVIHMAIVPIIALGASELIHRLVRSNQKYVLAVLLIFLCAVGLIMFGDGQKERFRIQDARSFEKDFNSVVPAGSIVFAERLARKHIDYFTDSYSFRFNDFLRPLDGITVKTGLAFFKKEFKDLYFFDNVDLCFRNRYNHTPVTKQRILDYYNLTYVKKFDSADYNLVEIMGKRFCTLWALEEWKEETTRQKVVVIKARDSVLSINARKLWSGYHKRKNVDLYFNDKLLSNTVEDGMNYYYLPKRLLTKGQSEIRLESDAPLPGDICPEVLDIYSDVVIDIGEDTLPLDTSYVSEEFFEIRNRHLRGDLLHNPRYRSIRSGTVIRIPTLKYPDSLLLISSRIRLADEASEKSVIRFSLNGKTQAEFPVTERTEWQSVCFLIHDEDITNDMSELVVDMLLSNEEIAGNRENHQPGFPISMDQLILHRYDKTAERIYIDIGADDDKYLKSGFHRKEKVLSGQPVRWTRGIGRIYLPVFGPERKLSIEIEAWGAPAKAAEKTTEVWINDRKIGEIEVKVGQKQSFCFDIPDGIVFRGFNELTLKTPIWRPIDVMESGDTRELGIFLDAITIYYNLESDDNITE